MSYLGNGINDLHSAYAHACYEGFPQFEYEDRDWEHYHKTKQDKRIIKKRNHTDYDVHVFAMFPQVWASTALGFGGMGGAAMTPAYTIILESTRVKGCCVYFGGRFAYRINKPNETFFDDVTRHSMRPVSAAKDRYEIKD